METKIPKSWIISIAFVLLSFQATANASILGYIGGIWAITEAIHLVHQQFEECPPVDSISKARGYKYLSRAEMYSDRVEQALSSPSIKTANLNSSETSPLASDLLVSNQCELRSAESWPAIGSTKEFVKIAKDNRKLKTRLRHVRRVRSLNRGEEYLRQMTHGLGFYFSFFMVFLVLPGIFLLNYISNRRRKR